MKKICFFLIIAVLYFSVVLTSGCSRPDTASEKYNECEGCSSVVPTETPLGCSDQINICSDRTRIEITVTDQDENPLAGVMIYHNDAALRIYNIDEELYPRTDSANRYLNYFVCTNAEGKASLCGKDNITLYGLIATKSEYSVGLKYINSDKSKYTLNSGDVLEVSFQLEPIAASNSSKVLALPSKCDNVPFVEAYLITNKISYAIPQFGKIVDTLIPNPNNLLQYYDTLVIGVTINQRLHFYEMLSQDNIQRIWDWIDAGGRMIFFQQNDSLWSVDLSCLSDNCPSDLFPPPYDFNLIPESIGEFEDCNDFNYGTIINTSHPFVQGVSFDSWEWQVKLKGIDKEFVVFDAIEAQSVNKTEQVWDIIVAGSPNASERLEHSSCFSYLAQENSAIYLMEAKPGNGRIIMCEVAVTQGAFGIFSGYESDPNAVKLMENIMEFIKNEPDI